MTLTLIVYFILFFVKACIVMLSNIIISFIKIIIVHFIKTFSEHNLQYIYI